MAGMGRLLLTPRWMRRTLLALLAITAFVGASVWQYQRTQDQLTVARAAVAQPSEFAAVVPPGAQDVPLDGLGRQVTVTGTVLPQARSFVRARLSATGAPGFLVVDGVRLANGQVVAVLQGWVPRPAAAPALAGRQVDVLGRLQPDENFYASAPVPASGPLLTITSAALATQWPAVADAGQLAPGYVTVVGTPAVPGLEPVRPVVGSDPDVPFPLQNAFYSLQWLIFAGVVVLVWLRWLREDAEEATRPPAAVPGGTADRVSLERADDR